MASNQCILLEVYNQKTRGHPFTGPGFPQVGPLALESLHRALGTRPAGHPGRARRVGRAEARRPRGHHSQGGEGGVETSQDRGLNGLQTATAGRAQSGTKEVPGDEG